MNILKGSCIKLIRRREPDIFGHLWDAEYSLNYLSHCCSGFLSLGEAIDYIRRHFGTKGIEETVVEDYIAERVETE